METKMDKLPKTALAFYVKLYCKRKHRNETKYYNNLIEATKSWLTLSKFEKEQFIEKYKECQSKYKKELAKYLKNALPYLKEKYSKRTPQLTGQDSEEVRKNDEKIPLEVEVQENSHFETIFENNPDDISMVNTTDPLELQELNGPDEHLGLELTEPAPPSIKNGYELFEMVKGIDEDNNSTWFSLPPAEKRKYQAVVLSLKKDYIKRYRSYLESLPSKELFHYYHNKDFTVYFGLYIYLTG